MSDTDELVESLKQRVLQLEQRMLQLQEQLDSVAQIAAPLARIGVAWDRSGPPAHQPPFPPGTVYCGAAATPGSVSAPNARGLRRELAATRVVDAVTGRDLGSAD